MGFENLLLSEKEHEIELYDELQRIYSLWRKFTRKKLKTVGVENLFVIWLGFKQDIPKIQRYLKLKCGFTFLTEYPCCFKNEKTTKQNKERLARLVKYGNEPTTIRLYTFLKTIELLNGDDAKTWITRKQLQIADHVSNRSVMDGCEFMNTVNYLKKRQDPKYAPTKGSISYNLTETGKNIIGAVDESRRKVDKEVWDDFDVFLTNRCLALEEQEYSKKLEIESHVVGLEDEVLRETILYTGLKVEPSREIIGKIDERILMAIPAKK